MKPNRLTERDYLALGLAIHYLTEKDYKDNIATDEEGNTFTKEELIAAGKCWEYYDNFSA